MWISASTLTQITNQFEAMREERVQLLHQLVASNSQIAEMHGMKSATERENARLQTMLELMRLRINQLEVANSELIARITGVKISVAEIEDLGVARRARPMMEGVDPFTDAQEAIQEDRNIRTEDQAQAETLLRKHNIRVPSFAGKE